MKHNRLTLLTVAVLTGAASLAHAGTVGISGQFAGDFKFIAMAHPHGDPNAGLTYMGEAIGRQTWSWDFDTHTGTFEVGLHPLTIGVPYQVHNANAFTFVDNNDGTYTGNIDFQVHNPVFGNPRAWLEITWEITDDGFGNLTMLTIDGDGNGFPGTIPVGPPNGWAGFPFPFEPTWDGVAVVPVPAAVWLFGSGLLGLVAVARRKKA